METIGELLRHLVSFLNDHDGTIVSIFTAVLAWSTIGLWRATNRLARSAEAQSDDMKASVAASTTAAAASKASAEAAQKIASINERMLTELERPWLFVEVAPRLIAIDNDTKDAPTEAYGAFQICNYGRGPAIIRECAEICNPGRGPDTLLLEHARHGTLGAGERTLRHKMNTIISLKGAGIQVDFRDEEPVTFLPRTEDGSWFFKIVIRYDGIAIKDRVSSHCWIFSNNTGQWIEWGGSEHNFQT
jgi:hypothetical protein